MSASENKIRKLTIEVRRLRALLQHHRKKNSQISDELAMAYAKLELLGKCIETEEGIFSFPDGDWVETKKIDKPKDQSREKR